MSGCCVDGRAGIYPRGIVGGQVQTMKVWFLPWLNEVSLFRVDLLPGVGGMKSDSKHEI
jgi:hypothetical protein